MIKKIKIFNESLYNLILGFWSPIIFQLIKFCINEISNNFQSDGEDLFIIIIFLSYIFLLFPINIIFFVNKKEFIEKLIPIFAFLIGILIGILFQVGGIINV